MEIRYANKYFEGDTVMRTMRYDVKTTVGVFLADALLQNMAQSKCVELADGTVVMVSYQGDIYDRGDVLSIMASNGIHERLEPEYTLWVQLDDPDALMQDAEERVNALRELNTKYHSA